MSGDISVLMSKKIPTSLTPMAWYSKEVCEYCVNKDNGTIPCSEFSQCIMVKYLQAQKETCERLTKLLAYLELNDTVVVIPKSADPNHIQPYDEHKKPLPSKPEVKQAVVANFVTPPAPMIRNPKEAEVMGNGKTSIENGIVWRDDITNDGKPCKKAWPKDNLQCSAFYTLVKDIEKRKINGESLYENGRFYWLVQGAGHPIYVGYVNCKSKGGA